MLGKGAELEAEFSFRLHTHGILLRACDNNDDDYDFVAVAVAAAAVAVPMNGDVRLNGALQPVGRSLARSLGRSLARSVCRMSLQNYHKVLQEFLL